jgi:hemolysin III
MTSPATAIDATSEQKVKPLLRGVSHQIAFFVMLLAGGLLISRAEGTTARLACAVYVTSVALLFGISALYHRPTWSVVARARMRRLDHSAIFILIAGTYTPMALTLPSSPANNMLTVAWIGGGLGVLRALFWVKAPKWLVAALALAMGWLAIFYFPSIQRVTSSWVVVWMALGGVSYSIGAIMYALRRPDPWPRIFGYHEIFHALVVVGVACHFTAVVIALPAIGRL